MKNLKLRKEVITVWVKKETVSKLSFKFSYNVILPTGLQAITTFHSLIDVCAWYMYVCAKFH